MASLGTLPPEIIVTHIVPYLPNADVGALAKVCSRLYAILRFERLYHLWPLYNFKYIEVVAFREEVATVIPIRRLVLVVASEFGPPDVVTDLTAFKNVHTADLRHVGVIEADWTSLAEVHTIVAAGGPRFASGTCKLAAQDVTVTYWARQESLPFLADVPLLDIAINTGTDISCLHPRRITLRNGALEDASSLVDAEVVHLVNCQVPFAGIAALRGLVKVELRASPLRIIPPELARVHTLDLSCSRELVDVANGHRVHTLILQNCKAVVDVSALGNVHFLDLTGGPCPDPNIEQKAEVHWAPVPARCVSSLGGVHTLILSYNGKLAGFEALGGNHTLVLVGAVRWSGIDNFSHLGGVHTLDLSSNRVIRSGAGLGRVYSLKLERCLELEDVSELGRVHHLDLTGCHGVTDVAALASVHTLILRDCSGLETVESFAIFGGVHCLDLSGIGDCYSPNASNFDVTGLGAVHALNLSLSPVKVVSGLSRVHTLNLSECRFVVDVSGLGSVYDLDLSFTNVQDVRHLGTVHRLILHHTPVVDVSSLGTVHTLDISYCPGVTDVSALGSVFVLHVEGCTGILESTALRTVKKLLGRLSWWK